MFYKDLYVWPFDWHDTVNVDTSIWYLKRYWTGFFRHLDGSWARTERPRNFSYTKSSPLQRDDYEEYLAGEKYGTAF